MTATTIPDGPISFKPRGYLSVCSGIEAASVAWHPLGWQPAAFAEVDVFPSAVLAHRFPGVLNLGDMTKFQEWPDANVSVLVGGTPCQSFSVAGLRAGLADPRGNLALVYLAIAERYRPTWVVWENVPGVLSSNGGRDFGAFLGGLGELGYGFAYRVLDAQYVRVDGFLRAVPQRRRRVFVVGYLGDWRPAAAVLFERESLSGHPAPRREAGAGVAAGVVKGAAIGRQPHNGPQYSDTLSDGTCFTLNCTEVHAVAIPFDATQITSAANRSNRQPGDPCHPLAAGAHPPAVAFAQNQLGEIRTGDVFSTLNTNSNASGRNTPMVAHASAVRRLTPTECERLQGFPDGWTAIPYRSKPATDGPRYKALGNSMAVNVMRWLGYRIDLVDKALSSIGRAAA